MLIPNDPLFGHSREISSRTMSRPIHPTNCSTSPPGTEKGVKCKNACFRPCVNCRFESRVTVKAYLRLKNRKKRLCASWCFFASLLLISTEKYPAVFQLRFRLNYTTRKLYWDNTG